MDISPEYPDEEEPVRGDPSFQELKNMTSQELAELQDGYQLTREHVGGGRDARPGWVEETCRRILSMRREQATFEANTVRLAAPDGLMHHAQLAQHQLLEYMVA